MNFDSHRLPRFLGPVITGLPQGCGLVLPIARGSCETKQNAAFRNSQKYVFHATCEC
jgi:hypothetical protein